MCPTARRDGAAFAAVAGCAGRRGALGGHLALSAGGGGHGAMAAEKSFSWAKMKEDGSTFLPRRQSCDLCGSAPKGASSKGGGRA